MTAPQPPQVNIGAGVIAVTTHGSVQAETADSLLKIQRRLYELNIGAAVDIRFIHGSLVDKARNEAALQLLQSNREWLWFLDGDMVFEAPLIDVMLSTAFGETPWADIVGGWCPLRGKPYLPTIDTGTGTWEPHEAGQGVVEVIRTGGACVLIKRHVFEKMEAPWYGVRPTPRALDQFAEVDNYLRCKFDGQNPFSGDVWDRAVACAQQDAINTPYDTRMPFGFVGEDSNFADKAKALGFRIVVQTNAVCGHVERHVITPADHANAIRETRDFGKLVAGIGSR